MSDPFVAEIRMFGGNFAPTGWAQCNGQLLPISQNTALFSLLGTIYGGDGKSTFALPNLQGSVPIAQGQGNGLSRSRPRRAVGYGERHAAPVGDPGSTHTRSTPTQTTRLTSNQPSPAVILGGTAGFNLCYATAEQHHDEPQALSVSGSQQSAQQHAAVSRRRLHHRDAGRLPAERDRRADTTSATGRSDGAASDRSTAYLTVTFIIAMPLLPPRG